MLFKVRVLGIRARVVVDVTLGLQCCGELVERSSCVHRLLCGIAAIKGFAVIHRCVPVLLC